jgi:hypothetical protein
MKGVSGMLSRRHLDTATILDYLEDRLAEARRREVDRHLGSPCSKCRERVFETASLASRMRADRMPGVPEELRRRALDVFQAAPRPAAGSRAARVLALVFDSAASPLPAATRRAVGEAHRLRFAHDDCSLEVEVEIESGDRVTLRGRLRADEPMLHRLEVAAGKDRLGCWPNADGAFALENLPRRPLRIEIAGPSGRLRIPPFTP